MRRQSLRRSLIAAAGGALVAAAASVPATAADNGSVTLTIPVAVYSVTVDPGAGTFGSCYDAAETTQTAGLLFPNGICRAPLSTEGANPGYITISNTGNAGHIDVQSSGTAAIPNNSAGKNWTICLPAGGPAACIGPVFSGTLHRPGLDQFEEQTGDQYNVNFHQVEGVATCDTALASNSCAAATNTSYRETILFRGPGSSTDQSATRTTSITWTIVP